ncbi:MAG: hypothetical protein IAE90_04515 [Ignavibacteria bacterium]|nr:hypothetical protein [Ignavibacteria bacterium]
MHQIYIASAVTTIFTFFLAGAFIRWRSHPEDREFLLKILLIELPMAFIAFYLIRMPVIDNLFRMMFGSDQNLYLFMKNFYAPLTEEPAKIFPLVFPFVRKRITKENFVVAAMALGLGFGIGEIWLLGKFIAESTTDAMPWYHYAGFMNERFMVCIVHGGMTAFVLSRPKNSLLLGLLGGMFLHFAGNFPIYLSAIKFAGLGKESWLVILQVWVALFFMGMLILLVWLSLGSFKVGKFFYGNSVCPECGLEYPAPSFAVNWVTKRYEKCPGCKKWHWVKTRKKA